MAGEWRNHPKLKGRFLADFPDDLQVIVHDGGPRITQNSLEVVWVSVTGMTGYVFRGRVLNQPANLKTVSQDSEIKFIVAAGAEFPVMVTDKYLSERPEWDILPCRGCGFPELFDAPSDLIRVIFPHVPADSKMSIFTSFCPLCRGLQGVKAKDESLPSESETSSTTTSAKRPWWKFW